MNPQANSESPSGAAASVNEVADFGPGKAGQAKRWKAELDSAKRSEASFVKRAEKTIKRYRDERDSIDDQDRKFNILWSNIQTLKPAVYAKPPEPQVSRRFDTTSQPARVAASILERNLHFTVCEHSMFDATMNSCVEDRLLPGRGTAWVRYVADLAPMYAKRPNPLAQPTPGTPTTGAVPPPPGEQAPAPALGALPAPTQPGIEQLPTGPLAMLGAPTPTPPATPPQDPSLQNKAVTDDSYESGVISGEQICFDYVHWKDFRMSPSRTWEECCWVARRVFMTRASGVKRFGKMFESVPLNYAESASTQKASNAGSGGNEEFGPGLGVLKKAEVWEIWSKDDLKVYWLCPDYAEILDERDDLFQLDEFFPCPKPLLATTTNDSTIPIPDYCMYQDQATELDQITNRISLLTQALKVIGVYDKTQDAVQRVLTEGVDNTMIPVDNWAMFAERGGLKGVVDFFPVEMVMNVLERLINARGVIKQDVYEITGIADIVRGASVASETATAQTIKEKFANIRINDTQKDIARFASDLINKAAQMMTNFFQPETLIVNADMQDPMGPDYPYVPAAVQLIKDGKLIQHKISVTVDAITAQDDKEEKAARAEFMQQFGYLMQQAVPAVEKMPNIAPMLGHVILWAVRGYKVGRDIEGVIEQGIAQLTAAGPQQPPPDPAAQKLSQEQAAHQQELQQADAEHQADMAKEADKLKLTQAANQEDLSYTAQKHEEELNFIRAKNALTLEGIALVAQGRAETAAAAAGQALDAAASSHIQGLVQANEKHALGLAQGGEKHAAGLAQGAEAHESEQERKAEAGDLALEQAENAARQKAEGEDA
jgi:hypothetical protein